jgi:hypothetical protein
VVALRDINAAFDSPNSGRTMAVISNADVRSGTTQFLDVLAHLNAM